MGINISLVRLLSIDREYGEGQIATFRTEDVEWFDWIRYVGDRQFSQYLLRENCHGISENDGATYPDFGARFLCRPKDVEAAKEWVRTQAVVPDVNKPRLLQALSAMAKESDLWFYW